MNKLKILCIFSLILFGVLFFAKSSSAANHVIRLDCASNGDGSSWNCGSGPGYAYNALPATLTRGDTYYFSKGTLTLTSHYHLNRPTSGATYITLKKATDSEHGPSTGWSTSLGNASTIFKSTDNNNMIFSLRQATSYYKIDGVYGSGTDANNYGFRFQPGTNPLNTQDTYLVFDEYNSGSHHHVEFSYIAFEGLQPTGSYCSSGIYGGDELTISHCLFDTFADSIHSPNDNLVVDNCIFTNPWSTSGCHGQTIAYNANNLTVKNSTFYNCKVGCITANGADSNPRTGWLIYNNVFIAATNRLWGKADVVGFQNCKFYNNTCVDGSCYFVCIEANCGNNEIKNNLFYNAVVGNDNANGVTYDYNYLDSTCTNFPTQVHGQTETVRRTDLFVDPTRYNFRIKKSDSTAINNASNLGSAYNVDADGVSRPQGSGWDMGAYEYGVSGPAPTLTPTPTPSPTATPTPTPTPSPTKRGDLNNDTYVDVIDLGIFLSNWNSTSRPPSDINQDGWVDVIDLGILLSNWG